MRFTRRVDRVVITDLRDNTFFALIHLQRNGEKLRDRRASVRRDGARASRQGSDLRRRHRHRAVVRVRRNQGRSTKPSGCVAGSRPVDPEELGRYEM